MIRSAGFLGLVVAAFWMAADGHARPSPLALPTAQDTLIATVHSVDAEAGVLEVVTGVGLALRIERVRVYRQVPIVVQGTEVWLDALAPGQIVRIVYRETAEGKVAESVQVARRPANGGAP